MKRLLIFWLCLLSFCLVPRSAFAQNNARMLTGVNYQTGTSYTFVAADATRLTSFNNASPVTATMLSGAHAGFGAGTVFSATNTGAGTVTIPCSGCTINGAASIQLLKNQSVDMYGDGTNFAGPVSGTAGAPNNVVYAASLCTTPGVLDQTCMANALASNRTIYFTPGTYNFSSIVHGFGLSQVDLECMAGVSFHATSALAELALFDDNSGASAGNSDITINGPCNWDLNGLASSALVVDSFTNATQRFTVSGGWTCTNSPSSHCMQFKTEPGTGRTKYLTHDLRVNNGTCPIVAAGFACVDFNYVYDVATDHIKCPTGSLGAKSYCEKGNGVDQWDESALTAYDYFSDSTNGDKGAGVICEFCTNITYHDPIAVSSQFTGGATCGTNMFCATGFYFDTCFNCAMHNVRTAGGTMGTIFEVSRHSSSDHAHIYFPGLVGIRANTRAGNGNTDTVILNALTSTTNLVAGSNWTLGTSGAPGSNCPYNGNSATVTVTATGTPSGAVVSQDFGSATSWIAQPLLLLCVNVSTAVNAGVLNLVADGSSSPFGGHTTIPFPALQPGWTPLELWTTQWPINWNTSGGPGVRSWGINATSAVPSGLVITLSRFAREVPGSDFTSDNDHVVNPGTDGILIGGGYPNFTITHALISDIGWTTNQSSICGIHLDATLFNNGVGALPLVAPHTMQFGLITENTLEQTPNTGGGSGNTLGICGKASATGGGGGQPQPITGVRVYKNQYPKNGFVNLGGNFNPCFGGLACMTDFEELPGDVENGLQARLVCNPATGLSGFGTTSSCQVNGTTQVGQVVIVANGASLGSSGSFGITPLSATQFSLSYPGTVSRIPNCTWTLFGNPGSASWVSGATVLDDSTASGPFGSAEYFVFWNNNGTTVTATNTYTFNYNCTGYRTTN